MTEADDIQPSASIASTGLGLRYIGNHCYAASGLKLSASSSSADILMLDFTSGNGYIVSKIYFGNNVIPNYVTYFAIDFNGERVMGYGESRSAEPPYQPILIPPFTRVQIYWGSNQADNDAYCFLTGRVYGAT